MTEIHDTGLQSLFRQAEEPLDGEAITARVMAAARARRAWRWGGGVAAILIGVLATWLTLGVPLLVFAVQVSDLLTMSLVDLGEGWLAVILMPLNSLAGLLALTAKGIQLLRRKVLGTSLVG